MVEAIEELQNADAHYGDDHDDGITNGVEITLESSIDELELSCRSYNCLKRSGIHTIGDLCKMTPDDLIRIKNLGRKSLEEIIGKLKSHGLSMHGKKDQKDVLEKRGPWESKRDELGLSIQAYNLLKTAWINTTEQSGNSRRYN